MKLETGIKAGIDTSLVNMNRAWNQDAAQGVAVNCLDYAKNQGQCIQCCDDVMTLMGLTGSFDHQDCVKGCQTVFHG